MHPYIQIFGRTIPLYGVFAAVGLIASIIYIKIAERRKKGLEADIELAAVYSLIGMIAGAKLLYLIIAFPALLQDIEAAELTFYELILKYMQGGFVFYGGLAGGVLAVYIYARAVRVSFDDLCSVLVPVIPLFHTFGRIGCFMSGCCYGIESGLFGIAFTDSLYAPNGVKLVPVQLMESFAELVLFIVLLVMIKKGAAGITLLFTWTLSYAAVRFALEFLRGDEERGFIGPLSTAQVMSVVLVLIVIAVIFVRKRRAAGC